MKIVRLSSGPAPLAPATPIQPWYEPLIDEAVHFQKLSPARSQARLKQGLPFPPCCLRAFNRYGSRAAGAAMAARGVTTIGEPEAP